jgi:hypothetical protein
MAADGFGASRAAAIGCGGAGGSGTGGTVTGDPAGRILLASAGS